MNVVIGVQMMANLCKLVTGIKKTSKCKVAGVETALLPSSMT